MKSRILIMMGLMLPAIALAGNEKGNGGGAFVCRDAAGNILSAELVDSYEARNQLGLTIRDFGGMSVDERIEIMKLKAYQANVVVEGRASSYGQEVDVALSKVRSVIRFVSNVVLENTNDFQISISPKSCAGGTISFEQLASYTPTDSLIVNQEIWQKLSPTDQAGLYIHEALYLLAREYWGSESSIEARWATGYFLSTVEGKEIPANVLTLKPAGGAPNTKWACKAVFFDEFCFEIFGCQGPADMVAKNTLTFQGKTRGDAAGKMRARLKELYRFKACTKYSLIDKERYLSGEWNYKFKCEVEANAETACYQQF